MFRKVFRGMNNEEFTGSTATLFVSHANLSDARGTRLLRQESVIRDNNKVIIKNLLENFNMEETKKKYAESKVVEITWDSNDFSFDTALSTAKVRARLQQLMGTDVIRINDRNYINRMLQKLEEERQVEVKKKEEALAEAEEERVRLLQLYGVIKKEKVEGSPKHKKTQYSKNDKKMEKSTEDGKYGRKERKEKDQDDTKDIVTQVEVESESEDCKKSKSKTHSTDKENKRTKIVDKESEVQRDVRKEKETESEDEVTTPTKQRAPKRETSFVRKLRNAETVESLYTVADSFVGSESAS